jgi:2-polyprenyl-6-methoxyphenol hydroxylase and related FAD-dependent oxidoreductases
LLTQAKSRNPLPRRDWALGLEAMKIACIGGGPAGLYFAISMKLRNADHQIDVFERNAKGVTFGWGVVFSDQTLENLQANDPVSAKRIAEGFAHWDDIEVHLRGEVQRSSGHGFVGIGRKKLLEILSSRAEQLGVSMHYETEFDPSHLTKDNYDLVIAADGVNSRIRDQLSEAFGVEVETRANKFVWLGTGKLFEAFTFAFEETEAGWIWAPRLPLLRRLLDLHRGMFGTDVARSGLRPDEFRSVDRSV